MPARAPELLKPSIAAAAASILLIASGVSLVEILVIGLGRIESTAVDDGGHDAILDAARAERGLSPFAALFSEPTLFGVLDEDGGSVLGAAVAELTSSIGRVHVMPLDIQEPRVGDARGVIDDADHL